MAKNNHFESYPDKRYTTIHETSNPMRSMSGNIPSCRACKQSYQKNHQLKKALYIRALKLIARTENRHLELIVLEKIFNIVERSTRERN